MRLTGFALSIGRVEASLSLSAPCLEKKEITMNYDDLWNGVLLSIVLNLGSRQLVVSDFSKLMFSWRFRLVELYHTLERQEQKSSNNAMSKSECLSH